MTTDEIKIPDPDTGDKVKFGVAVALVVAGVAGYYVLQNSPTWMRWLAVAAGLALGILVVGLSRYGAEFRQFLDLSRVELRKIVWPSRNETFMTTVVVFVFVTVAGIFFWGLDWLLALATRFLTGQGS